jgi:arylsulfatase A-like enzyme
LIFLLLFTGGPLWSRDDSPPNILVILVDDLGYGDVSIHGGMDIHTPNMDELCRQGMHFSNFYANCTVCSPTRASLLTGRYPDLAGVPGVIRTHETNSWGYLREDLVTLPQMLKKAGYHTALIGKWHLGLESPNTPNERGFDFFHGFLGDMMDDYYTHLRHGNNYMRLNEETVDPQGHATDIFTVWTIEYLQSQKGSGSPFFLYLAYNAPHFPIQPPDDYLEKVLERESGIENQRARNVALVEHLDDAIGRVMKALEELYPAENTLIIFSSDNGGHLPSGASNGNLRGGKQDFYEGGIKVPTCFVWKNRIEAGSETGNMGLTMDIFPTLLEITGVDPPESLDGISLYPTLMGMDQVTDDRIVYFMRREGGIYGGLCYYATRQGPYKLVQNTPFEPMQLFDLESDPGEQTPLDPGSETFDDLKYRQSQHIRMAGRIPWQKQ